MWLHLAVLPHGSCMHSASHSLTSSDSITHISWVCWCGAVLGQFGRRCSQEAAWPLRGSGIWVLSHLTEPAWHWGEMRSLCSLGSFRLLWASCSLLWCACVHQVLTGESPARDSTHLSIALEQEQRLQPLLSLILCPLSKYSLSTTASCHSAGMRWLWKPGSYSNLSA